MPLDEDHISICKPPSRDAPLYKSIQCFLTECLKAAEGAGASARSGPAGVSGAWVAEVVRKGRAPFRIGLDLEAIGTRLFGTVSYPTGPAGIADGVVDGERVSFRTVHTPQFETEPAEIRFEGTIGAETIALVVQDPTGHARATATRTRRG